ncbi:MAG: tetratricopeptide repeat protein [Gemmataceae bacterium]|nr:tetratricopeptide repeat protein [Gemmataceae bacterium]
MSRRRWPSLCVLWLLLIAVGILAQVPELPPVGGKSKPGSSGPTVSQPPRNPPTPPLPPLGGKLGDPLAPGPVGERSSPAGVADAELAHVQRVLAARREYLAALRELLQHYRQAGDTRKAQWVEDELRGFFRGAHPVYRLDLDVPSPALRPSRDIPEANDLYRWAMSYKDKGVGPEYQDNQRRAELLLQDLLTRFPDSTRIVEAAYALGELYESRAFRQFERAAAYYERSVQWDPTTRSDARLRIARIYDRDLRDRARAIEWYRQVIEHDPSPSRRQEAQRRLNELTPR